MTDKQYIYIIQEVLQNDILYTSLSYYHTVMKYIALTQMFKNNSYYSNAQQPCFIKKFEIGKTFDYLTNVNIDLSYEDAIKYTESLKYNKFGDEVDY